MRFGALLLLLAWTGCNDKDSDSDTDVVDTDVPDTDTDTDTVDTDVDTDTDVPDTDTDDGTAYSHTVIVDGNVGDFLPGEFFQTSTSGRSSYIAWDETDLFVGLFNADVEADASHAALIYLSDGSENGTRQGVAFNSQQPQLPFPATHLVEWRADNSSNAIWDFTDGEWNRSPNFLLTQGSLAEDESATAVEFRIPLNTIGADDSRKLRLHISWIDDQTLYEKTTAGTPDESFFDRYDPDYTQYLEFDLDGTLFPNNYQALPALPFEDTGDTDTGDTGDTGIVDPGTGPWRTDGITVDGNASDFGPGETFETTAGVVLGVPSNFWITWDDANVYAAARHRDVEYGTSKNHLLVYFGNGGAGTTTGIKIGGQQPKLPFAATHAVEWRADGSYDALWTFAGGVWTAQGAYLSTGMNGADIAELEAVQTVEFSLPWTALGLTDTLLVHEVWIDDSAAAEKTYSGAPVESFTNATFDPDYTVGYAFDLLSTRAPAFTLPVDAAGNPVGTPGYTRTAVVDGNAAEYPNDEDFTSSTVGVKAHATWDESNLYLAYEQPDIATAGARQALLVYIGNGSAGTLTGLPIGAQQPSLPFRASYALKWLGDDSSNSLYEWNGNAWIESAGFLGTKGSAYAVSIPKTTFEASIPLTELDVSTILDLHFSWVDDRVGLAGTEGAVPAGSFVDGFDPNYSQYFHFDLTDPMAPSDYPASP